MKLKMQKKKEQKLLTFNSATRLLKVRQKVLNRFESETFPIGKQTQSEGY